jgi:hypothetical protein
MPQELSDQQDKKRSKCASAASKCSTKLALAHLEQQAA